MIQSGPHSALALAALLSFGPHAFAQESPVTIEVDAVAPEGTLEPIWAYFGYDEANYTTDPQGRALLGTLASMHRAPVHIRTHFLFNSGDGTPSLKWGSTNLYTEDETGAPRFDYTIIDQIMDATLDAGTFPLFELGFMPQALSIEPEPYEPSGTYVLDGGSFYPPRDYEKWAALVAAYADHARVRYGSSQTNWMWELWNEPDIGYWHGTAEEYARLYDYTEAALHAVLPDAPLGAPAVASPEGAFLAEFLAHCASGENAVSGQTGTRLDLVTFHAKGGVAFIDEVVQMDLGNQLRLHRAGFEGVAASAFAETPIVISEADPDGCAACPDPASTYLAYRNSPAYGAYEVAMMKRSLDLAADVGVELRGVLTWAFTFPGSPYFMGYRELATNGIHLPVLNAFKLLAELRGERIPALSSAARPLDDLLESGVRAEPDIDALAAVDGDTVRILVWNYHDDLAVAEPTEVALRVALPAALGGRVAVTHHRVDDVHGNAFTVWDEQGRPSEPSDAQLAQLYEAMDSLLLEPERAVEVTGGSVALSFDLPRFGVSLVTLAPASDDEPPDERGGCSCRLSPARPMPPAFLLALVLGSAAARRRRAAGIAKTFS